MLLITGTGRSGTHYMSHVMRAMGFEGTARHLGNTSSVVHSSIARGIEGARFAERVSHAFCTWFGTR